MSVIDTKSTLKPSLAVDDNNKVVAREPDLHGDKNDPWEILEYELVEAVRAWAPEDEVLERQDVQDAIAEGLRELRDLREQRDND
jgi:hypothetical protein